MSCINKVILIGHLGKDPELRQVTENVLVVSFPLATTENFVKGGEKTERTEWHNIIMWRDMAFAASKELKKNSLIYIEGKLQTRTFIDSAGIKKFTTEVIASHFSLLSSV